MNVYDQAHSLATAVKESEEYKQFQARKKDIEGNPELEKALNDFLKQQFEMQAAQAMGQPMDPESLGKLQQLSGILMQDPAAAQYLQCQMRFSMMMADVYKILAEVSDLGIDQMIGGDK